MTMSCDYDGVLNKEKITNYLEAFDRSFEILKEEEEYIEYIYNKDDILVIFQDYDKIAKCVKIAMEKHTQDEFIDSHKIAAIFVMLLLKHSKLITAAHIKYEAPDDFDDDSIMAKLPHIYFAFILGTVIVEGMYNVKNGTNKIFDIKSDYAIDFVKLVYANEKAIASPLQLADCDNRINGIFFLSHLFYFVEIMADKSEVEE